jgi:hypothetical protein
MSIHRSAYEFQQYRIRLMCGLVAAGLLLSAMAAIRADDGSPHPVHTITGVDENGEIHLAVPGQEPHLPQSVCVVGPEGAPATGVRCSRLTH